jgi:Holliday junction resolvase
LVQSKRKGTRLEHEIKQYLEHFGYYVIRAAGSFGIDLIAIRGDQRPLLINVKWRAKYLSRKEAEELMKEGRRIQCYPILAFKHYKIGSVRGQLTLKYLSPTDSWIWKLPSIKKTSQDEFAHSISGFLLPDIEGKGRESIQILN